MTRLRGLAALVAALFLGGCMLQNQAAPPLSGPSTFAKLLTLTPTPEVLPRDGTSQAVVTVNARDQISDTPISGQRLTITAIQSTAKLSATEVTTGADGRAMFSVTAPPAAARDTTISIVATPIEGISDQVSPAILRIRLLFDTILDPAARFTVTPVQPTVDAEATFDASASTAVTGRVIALYAWSFGDGTSTATTQAITKKAYTEARTFAVTLTVFDNLGNSSTTARLVTVVP